MRDIDRILASVQQRLPDVTVVQHVAIHPGDDDGIWWFSLPGVSQNVHLEAPFGNCPFLVETNEQCCKDALKATTVQEAVTVIVEYLAAAKEGRTLYMGGQLYWQS
jgi:hypothetical protein